MMEGRPDAIVPFLQARGQRPSWLGCGRGAAAACGAAAVCLARWNRSPVPLARPPAPLQEKWLATVATSVCVWGPYNVMSFKCIPEQLRILCGNTAGILWGVYMSCSCVNQAPAAPAACPPASAAAAVAAALEAQGR